MSCFVLGTGGSAITIPVPKAGALVAAPDGQGKWRWTLDAANVAPSVLPLIVAMIGVPSGAESVRAWDGTLLTDRPLVAVSGDLFGATIYCEITLTNVPYRAPIAGSGALYSRRPSLTLREG